MAKFSELDRSVQESMFFAQECFKISCLVLAELTGDKDTEITKHIASLSHHFLSTLTAQEFESILSRFIEEYDNLDSKPRGISIVEIRLSTGSQD